MGLPRGIQITAAYDLEGQLTNRVFTGLTLPRAESYSYDGLHRLKSVKRIPQVQSGSPMITRVSPKNSITITTSSGSTPSVASLDFSVLQQADNGGFRSQVTYPFGEVTVDNKRDNTGRLLALIPTVGEVIVATNEYAGDSIIGTRLIGPGKVKMENAFDSLKRTIGRRYTNPSTDKTTSWMCVTLMTRTALSSRASLFIVAAGLIASSMIRVIVCTVRTWAFVPRWVQAKAGALSLGLQSR